MTEPRGCHTGRPDTRHRRPAEKAGLSELPGKYYHTDMNMRICIPATVFLFILYGTAAAQTAQPENLPLPELSVPAGNVVTASDISEPLLSVEETGLDEKDQTRLVIKTNPPDASLYINSLYQGTTPLNISDLKPGIYRITLSKDGYYTRNFFIEIKAGTEKSLYVEMSQITGFLVFSVSPPDSQIYVDGQLVRNSGVEVPEGLHQITIRRFGYTDYRSAVQVVRNRTGRVTAVLEKAPFGVSGISLSKSSFNPENPGSLGQTVISFDVSAPGTGTIVITGPDGRTEKEITLPVFSTWEQNIPWNGRDAAGSPLPDGTYTISLRVRGSETPDTVTEKTAYVSVDAAIRYPFVNISASGGSTGQAPAGSLFPRGTMYFSFKTGAFVEPAGKGFLAVPLDFNFLATPFPWLELNAGAGMYIDGSDTVPLFAGAGIKAGRTFGIFSGALFLRYRFVSENISPVVSEGGLAFGGAAEWRFGSVSAGYTTEAVFGPERGILVPFSAQWNNAVFLRWQTAYMGFGLWTKLYSAVTGKSFTFFDSLYGGLEYFILIPDTSILIQAHITAGTDKSSRFFLSPGAGFNILF